jgi:hypothetical protein
MMLDPFFVTIIMVGLHILLVAFIHEPLFNSFLKEPSLLIILPQKSFYLYRSMGFIQLQTRGESK